MSKLINKIQGDKQTHSTDIEKNSQQFKPSVERVDYNRLIMFVTA